jgi:hypothetical protein
MPWQATARDAAQRLGLDPRYVRRFRWVGKAAAVRRYGAPVSANLPYVLTDPELANFTYELANEDALATWVSEVTDADRLAVRAVFQELHDDRAFGSRLQHATGRHWLWSKRSPPPGKRIGWYAFVRLLKPALVIENGVHDGLGSLLLLRALERNADEQAAGRLVSFDINPAAGWIVGEHPLWELRIESSRTGLPAVLAAGEPVGILIHDSLHSYEHEHFELASGASQLAPSGLLITDNAHATTALKDVCESFGLRYFEFRERASGHFYPGGAVGAGRR